MVFYYFAVVIFVTPFSLSIAGTAENSVAAVQRALLSVLLHCVCSGMWP